MEKPILIIMAAGMGSRYGGLKQIDPIDQEGHIIMDFSLFDARRAGFETVVFVIKKENEEIFKEVIGKRLENICLMVTMFLKDVLNLGERLMRFIVVNNGFMVHLLLLMLMIIMDQSHSK